ncbi:MAG: TonB-dependent receptor [Candidatus Zhuqueibacterota bacterium]
MKRNQYIILCLWLGLSLVTSGFSQTKGTIRGQVLDAETKTGLPSVNVLVQGTYSGAATDMDGNFTIPNVSPGDFTLQFSMIGYTMVQKTGVKVVAGEVTQVVVELTSTVLALGQEVMVIGEKPLFNIDETSSRRTLTSSEIEKTTLKSVKDIVAAQVGVIKTDDEIHIRGGRTYENAFLLDGISVQDPLSGTGFGLRLSTDAIEEVEIITGGFNAEYGQAMSGIVDVKTKEGSEVYHASISYKRDNIGVFDKDTPIIGSLSKDSPYSFNTDVVELSLYGPEPLTRTILPSLGLKIPGSLYFFTNAYMYISDDFTKVTADQLYSSTFHGETFAPRQMNNWSGMAKITWRIDPSHKLIASYNQSVTINQNTQSLQTNLEYVPPGPGYPYEYEKNLDNFNTFTHLNNQFSLHWTQTVSNKTFFEIKLSRYFANLRSDLRGQHWTTYQEPKDIVTQPIQYYFSPDSTAIYVIPGDGFWDYGNSDTWHDHYVEDYTLKFDISSHRSERHKMKAGIEMNYREMQLIDIYRPWFGELGLNNDIYKVHPNFGAAYIQDNITFRGLIANLGLRFDYWFPGEYVDDAVKDPEVITISDATRQAYTDETYSLFGHRWKGRLSPRIGVSHPITDNQMLFFSYGHFSKMPRPQFVYAKLGRYSAKSTFQKFGNPNLNPETTVAYELGLKHKFTENDVFTVTTYYRDIFDYVTTVSFRGSGRLAGRSFITYMNLDYSRSRGVEIEYKKRAGRYFTGSFSFSYSIATGKSSNPDDALLVAQGSLEEKPITENFLIWDRPIQGAASFNLFMPKENTPAFYGWKIPGNWNFNLRVTLQSGKRYTPYYFTGSYLESSTDLRPEYRSDVDNPYSEIADYWMWADLNLEKYYKIARLNVIFSIEVLNVFNRKNSNIINPVTGQAYEYGDPTPNSWNDPLYPDVQAPLDPYPYNPARYLNPRNIKLGFKLRF